MRTIVKICSDVSVVLDVAYIPMSIYNINQSIREILRRPLFITSIDHGYILDEIIRQKKMILICIYKSMMSLNNQQIFNENNYQVIPPI